MKQNHEGSNKFWRKNMCNKSQNPDKLGEYVTKVIGKLGFNSENP